MEKVLVFQTWGIGDMVMTTPMLDALKKNVPGVAVHVVAGSRAAADVIEGSPLHDSISIISPKKMGSLDLVRSLHRFRKASFDAAILATRLSSQYARLLRSLSGIKVIAGDGFYPRRWGYSHWLPVEPEMHRVEANLRILRLLCPGAEEGRLHFHLDEASRQRTDEVYRELGLQGGEVLAIHPGSDPRSSVEKRYPEPKYRKVMEMLFQRKPDLRVLVFLGPDEQAAMEGFRGCGPRVSVVQGLPLRVVAGLIARAKVFLSGDAGLGHIAAAFGVPTVTLAGPTEVRSTRPWSPHAEILRTAESLDCMPCYGTSLFNKCPYSRKCMFGIEETAVADAICGLLRQGSNQAFI